MWTVKQSSKTVWHKNPISGHEWCETIIIPNSFYVSGPWVVLPYEKFKSEKKAQEYADFRNELDRKFPFDCPRSARELKFMGVA